MANRVLDEATIDRLAAALGRALPPKWHVVQRLDCYRAGRRMDFAAATPEVLGEAIAAEIDRRIDYRPVETDGAARAARLIAEVL